MIRRMDSSQFHRAFANDAYGGGSTFSHDALNTIYDILEDEDEDFEFDYVEIRDRFTEYQNMDELIHDLDGEQDAEEMVDSGEAIKIIDFNDRDTGRLLVDRDCHW